MKKATDDKPDLLLFTNSFPFSLSEETYLIEECRHLASAFRRVIIVTFSKGATMYDLPPNVESHSFTPTRVGTLKKIAFLLSDLGEVFREWRRPDYVAGDFLNLCREYLTARSYEEFISCLMSRLSVNPDRCVFYTYWCYTTTLALCILRRRHPGIKAISRAHSGDLYFNPREKMKTAFYSWKLRSLNRLFVISEHGRRYLAGRFPEFGAKIVTNYLGGRDLGVNTLKGEQLFTMVSVSKFSDRKRVYEIPRILSLLEFRVRWVHFGWGAEEDHAKVRTAMEALPSTVEVEMKGMVPNEEILRYYDQDHVNLFINVSVKEGLPFSALEALSFGIPLILTDTNGAAELIRDNGFLIPVDFEPDAVAKAIAAIRNGDQGMYRQNSRALFTERFSAGANYPWFIEQIGNL